MPEACFQHAPEDDTYGRRCARLHAYSFSRANGPEFCQRAKGARALKRCDPVATQGSSSAPAPVACRAGGAVTSSASPSVRLRRPPPSLASSGPRAAALRSKRSAAADGRPRGLLPFHAAPIAGPGICGELSRTSDAATVRRRPQPGTAPVPQSRSSLPRPVWAGVRRVWGSGEGRG